ncbi:aminotransferase class I/II-fold pyridoxal phosphate-dependent enzyme [Halobacteriovorax sp. HLS]|uniref:aminotransferase class I/II-fold pyridoxal phosphate-dependent enzyme n=1 Tax=Halobacteriovorax sp. HLS TaxID=2234000 RepID=UPI000FD7603A|nr:aminotransferase class I/II-fold pyridoxal phosphate-dependent enzyme [Halobacteriovorax sp. HLS]
MKISKRVSTISESITLKLNAQAVAMEKEGKQVWNLTAGQLPFRPGHEFTEALRTELVFLNSFQYSPVAGFKTLREKVLTYFEESRDVKASDTHSVLVSNGGKHSLANVFASIIDKDDEVIIPAPYWVSYPEMVSFYDGKPVTVASNIYDEFHPSLEDIESAINKNTKAIIINSPNNPSGVHYSEKWMRDFASLMLKYPDIIIISDEIYYELSYFDPKPTYFYQYEKELIERTIIIDGVSKNMALTGLRIGFCIAPNDLISAMSRLQGQTTSGANSLIQKALEGYNFNLIGDYLEPIKAHLRENSRTVQDKFRENKLAQCWYQTKSAFYFLVDFSGAPIMDKYLTSPDDKTDYSTQICSDLLEKHGVAIVPGGDFGIPNSARISLVPTKDFFAEAIGKIVEFMKS